MVRTEEDREAEQMIMDLIARNTMNDAPNEQEQDHREADSYLNMFADGNEREQPIAQGSNDGEPSEV